MFLAGIQAKARTGPPIEAFGGDTLGINSHKSFLNTRQLAQQPARRIEIRVGAAFFENPVDETRFGPFAHFHSWNFLQSSSLIKEVGAFF
jgi:hypothetical protein